MFFWIELTLAVLSIAVAYSFPSLGASWFARAEHLLSRLAQRRGLAVAVVGAVALAARVALLPILPIPQPGGHDDFGYLLLADTFAHGRLTNPTHPMWVHFESFHIIWQPTYTAMFYPAQGVIMALGQIVMGHPFWGVWLSVGVMCAAICWMLQGWLPPGWALLGGLLAVIRLGTFSYWANSYFGGAVAATGGALVLGALARIKRSRRLRDALLMGLGFAIVANSRPYEGLFFSLPVVAALAVWMFGKNRPLPEGAGAPPLNPLLREEWGKRPTSNLPLKQEGIEMWWKRVVTPLSLVLVLAGCGMGYYFWRTTGSPWETPHLLNARTYNPAPYFPWQTLRPMPVYHHAVMRELYLHTVVGQYEEARSITGMIKNDSTALVKLWGFYLGPALTLPLVAVLATLPYRFSWRDIRWSTRFLFLICATVIAGSMLPIYFLPHYAAPIACAVLAVVLQSMRHLRSRSRCDQPASFFIARAIPLICLAMLALRVGTKPLHLPLPPAWPGAGAPTWCSPAPENVARARLVAELSGYPGRQLAIVRYGPHHDVLFHEWVYNEASIDRAKVVWARDMGPAKNQELIDYFHDRAVWLVEADETPPKLSLYQAPTEHVSSRLIDGAR
jgi:hypothetical protein